MHRSLTAQSAIVPLLTLAADAKAPQCRRESTAMPTRKHSKTLGEGDANESRARSKNRAANVIDRQIDMMNKTWE